MENRQHWYQFGVVYIPMLDNEVIRVPTCICAAVGGDLEYVGTAGGCARIHCLTSVSLDDASRPVKSKDWIKIESFERRGLSFQLRSTKF
jgi:hypothetical protein